MTLAEASAELGGRVTKESKLPGLAAWSRVVDYRLHDLKQRGNVQLFTDSRLDGDQVAELGVEHVFVATGSLWRTDGMGRNTQRHVPQIEQSANVLTPDNIMNGVLPRDGPVMIYDDDHIYLAGVIAEKLATAGYQVVFVTPESLVSAYSINTLEQPRIQARLMELGIDIRCNQVLTAVQGDMARIGCAFTGREMDIPCASTILVTERQRGTTLYDSLRGLRLKTVELIGDAASPGLIVDAVFAGHRAARDFERPKAEADQDWFRREIIDLEETR